MDRRMFDHISSLIVKAVKVRAAALRRERVEYDPQTIVAEETMRILERYNKTAEDWQNAYHLYVGDQ